MTAADVVAGLRAALRIGVVSADVVAMEARSAANADASPADVRSVAERPQVERRVLSLTQRRLTDPAAVMAGLPADQRPLPSVAGYDDLLALARRRADLRPNSTEEAA